MTRAGQSAQAEAPRALASAETPFQASQHPSAGTDSWTTPAWLAAALGPVDLDPCSNERSHIRARRMLQLEPVDLTIPPMPPSLDEVMAFERRTRTQQADGLAAPWVGSVFVNPPYSAVGPWAARLAAHDGPWIALLKLDPTTRWWATLMAAAPIVAPFRKRIAFETDAAGKRMTANFPSVLVYSAWRPPAELAPHLWLTTYAEAGDR